MEKAKSEKALIKKGYSRVMEKIKELRQKSSNAVTMGSRSGSGKLVMEFYDVMVKILGRINKIKAHSGLPRFITPVINRAGSPHVISG